MSDNPLYEGCLFGLGNPLLDISCNVPDDSFINKYKLPKNQAIIATPEMEAMFDDMINTYEIDYTAGGATQNTLRFCQWVLGRSSAYMSTFVGSIGNDFFGRMMEKKAKSDGVKVMYQVNNDTVTGTCAVFVSDGGSQRTLVAYLGAAETFKKEHLIKNWHWVEKARAYYVTGHSLSVTPDSVLTLATFAHKDQFAEKFFFFNLAAPYVSEKYIKELTDVLPHIDYFFGNDAEALAFAKARGYPTTDMKEICKMMANEPKEKGVRTAIVTQGANPVLVARTGDPNVAEYPVPQVEIVDTNGAGDAFTGGFLAQFMQDKDFDTCMKCAIYCASECIQVMGATFPKQNKWAA